MGFLHIGIYNGCYINVCEYVDIRWKNKVCTLLLVFDMLTCIIIGIYWRFISKYWLWLQIFADIWGVKVRSRSIVEDANSLGAAVTTLVALGKGEFSMVKNLSTITAEYSPSSENQRYQAQHQIFLDGYYKLEDWFSKRKIEN
jgi:hypothetical protein